MQSDATRKAAVHDHSPEPAGSAVDHAPRRLAAAITGSLASLIDDTVDLDNQHIAALTPSNVLDALLHCVEGVSLNLRRLEIPAAPSSAPARQGGYEDPACVLVLIAARLPASAWDDLQRAAGQRFSEVILPDMMGSYAAFAGFRQLDGLRSISIALDPAAATVDLRPLAGISHPVHVEIRCPSRLELDVLAPEGVTVSAEIEGGLDLAMSHVVPVAEPQTTSGFGVSRIAVPAIRYRLFWSAPALRVAPRNLQEKCLSWLRGFSARFSKAKPLQTRSLDAPIAVIRDECFAALEDAMIRGSGVIASAERRHAIRCQAIHMLDRLHAGTLDLDSSGCVCTLVASMKHGGWLALERYCHARYGCGIRKVVFAKTMSNREHDEVLFANLGQLRELSEVQFGRSQPLRTYR